MISLGSKFPGQKRCYSVPECVSGMESVQAVQGQEGSCVVLRPPACLHVVWLVEMHTGAQEITHKLFHTHISGHSLSHTSSRWVPEQLCGVVCLLHNPVGWKRKSYFRGRRSNTFSPPHTSSYSSVNPPAIQNVSVLNRYCRCCTPWLTCSCKLHRFLQLSLPSASRVTLSLLLFSGKKHLIHIMRVVVFFIYCSPNNDTEQKWR